MYSLFNSINSNTLCHTMPSRVVALFSCPPFDFNLSIPKFHSSMLSIKNFLPKCADRKWWPSATSRWWNKIHCRIVKKSNSIYNLLVVPMFLILNKVRHHLMRTRKTLRINYIRSLTRFTIFTIGWMTTREADIIENTINEVMSESSNPRRNHSESNPKHTLNTVIR